MTEKIYVLDDGFIRLENSSPDPELMIVNAARVSFNKRKSELDSSDRKLIAFLLKNRHGTPFEMVEFWFHVRVPIFVTREWHRHRIASYNEMSGRYVELPQVFYVPELGNIRRQTGKPGRYTFERFTDHNQAETARSTIRHAYAEASRSYARLLKMGVAKEQARIVLPVGIYTEFYFKTNARSLMNFLSLRNAPNAMWEIQQYAEAIEIMFEERLPTVHDAFVKSGRIAP